MAFLLTDFVQQLKELEQLLAEEFHQLSLELRKKTAAPSGDQVKFRLVEQLQYHDIIRQKLEHVRHFGEQLLADQQQKTAEEQEFDPGLIELSLALLRFTSMEYQEVNKKTYQLLFTTDPDTKLIPENPSFEREIQELIRNLGNLYLELDTPEEDETEGGEQLKYHKILNSFSMKTEREVFAMLFDEEASLSDGDQENQEGEIELF